MCWLPNLLEINICITFRNHNFQKKCFFFPFQLDGKVSFHRLVVAAASPLLREAMSQDQTEELIISVPEITSSVMAAMMDLLYKGRMYITPSNTWDIRSLVEILTINAEDVSVISGSRLPPITTSASSQSPVLPASVPASKSNVTEKSATTNRKRRRQTLESVPPVASKISKSKYLPDLYFP